MRQFALYPEAQHWWSMNDHACVFDVTERLKPKRVLEFGPGSSTLALIEGGAGHITSCEDSEDWARVYRARIEVRFPDRVKIQAYRWADPLTIPEIDAEHFDMALIDGPYGTENRPAVIRYCVARCDSVLVCCEDSKGRGLREDIARIALETNCDMELMITGPLSGSFALLHKRT